MSNAKHILSQGPVIASLASTAISALLQRVRGAEGGGVETPGPVLEKTIPPRPDDLVRDYVRHVGGDPSAYRGRVPAHLFPQWGFPLAARTLRGIPYPMQRVLNGGCRLEIHGDLPAGVPLRVTACLEDIDDNGRRAVLHQKVVTGTAEAPELVVGHLYAIVPLGGGNGEEKKDRKDKARVPDDATELAYWKIPHDAGLQFAMLTGDFNPVHWVTPYAKAFGFRNRILHGFATMARAIEGLNRSRYSGNPDRIAVFDCKFTRPLVLPARAGLYVKQDDVYVGAAPGGPAYLVGTYEER